MSTIPMHFQGTVLKRREVSGFELMEAVYSPRTKVPKHSHRLANFCIALKGTCTELYGNKVREYKTLTLDFLPAGQTHSLSFPLAELRCFSVDVAPHWLERMRECSLTLNNSVHCYGGSLAHLFMKLYREFHALDSAASIAIEGLAVEMLAEVARYGGKAADRKLPHWLGQARELLHAHFGEPLKLAAIAETVGVHPVHLSREFHKHYRCTMGDYIRKLRIDYACHELSLSDKPLVEIAAVAGFADQSHFSRIFKRQTGVTPARYRTSFPAR